MTLYTPVFPQTEPPPSRTSSSSSSSTATGLRSARRPHTVSYSSRLSQRHLAIAALPELLCQHSPPPSPSSKERAAKLQEEIEHAVQGRHYLGDLCKLRCTRIGATSSKPSGGVEILDAEQLPIPWILAETEDEWFEWEHKVAELRAKPTSREKVMTWKARLEVPAPITPITALLKQTNKGPRDQSPLGFPVVKRSSMLKEGRLKTSQAFATPELNLVGAQPEHRKALMVNTNQTTVNTRATGEDGALELGAMIADSIGVSGGGANDMLAQPSPSLGQHEAEELPIPREETRLSQLPEPSQLSLPPSFPSGLLTSTPKAERQRTAELVMHGDVEARPQAKLSHLSHFHAFDLVLPEQREDETSICHPPSFPPNLMTSSPKAVTRSILPEQRGDEISICRPPSFPSNLMTSSPKAVTRSIPEVSRAAERIAVPLPESDLMPGSQPHLEPTRGSRLIVISTPPSPPPSTSKSPGPYTDTIQRAASASAAPLPVPTSPPGNKQARPLTPPSDNGVSISAVTPHTPRTPERQPLKKYRTIPSGLTPYEFAVAVGPSTPVSSINGVSIARDAIPFPQTPDCHMVIDLLATSRRSKPRPRPPSRKLLAQQLLTEGANSGEEDPSPAKSDRSYFSSPASGDSAGSTPGSTGHVPNSPASPLGFFTQNPGHFAPAGESTQPLPQARAVRTPVASQVAALRAHLSQSQDAGSQKGLVRTSSGLLGMTYNSQYDVDANVHSVSNFLERDVDFAAWVRDTDDDGDDEVQVENLTKTGPSEGSSQVMP